MKRTLLFLLTVMSLSACHKSSNNPTDPIHKFDSIYRANLTGFTNMFTGYGPIGISQYFYYTYAGDKFSLRIGGFAQQAYTGGYNSVFLQLRYDTVVYGPGSISVIARATTPGVLYGAVDTVYFAVANNKPQTKIYYDRSLQAYDTTTFYYSSNRLTRTVEDFRGGMYEKIYNYSPSGNLQSISGVITALSAGTLGYTTEETFGDYDSTRNPLTDYWMWDESFERSLSANNFRSYHYSKVYVTPAAYAGAIADSISQKWHFTYVNGVVDYSTFSP